jgi:hypothetical protein
MPVKRRTTKKRKTAPARAADSLELIEKHFDEFKPDTMLRRIWNAFLSGVFRGVGFVIGSTIIVALVIVIARGIVTSNFFQRWAGDAVNELILNVLPEEGDLINAALLDSGSGE